MLVILIIIFYYLYKIYPLLLYMFLVAHDIKKEHYFWKQK